jgi:hypothetical protein
LDLKEEKCMKVKFLTILIVMGLVTLSCGFLSQSEGEGNKIEGQPQMTESVEESVVKTDPVTAEPTEEPESTEIPTQESDEPIAEEMAFASWEELESFHLVWSWVLVAEDGAEVARYSIIQKYDGPSEASHIIVSTPEEGVFIETIVIGGQGWMSVAGTDVWLEMEIETGIEAVDLHTWGGFWADAETLEYVGEEQMNGVNCDHYVLAERGNFYLSNPEDGTMLGYVTEGEVWIANQSDLPPVDVRGRMMVREGFFPFPSGDDSESGELEMFWEYDLTNINQPVGIAAPE